jgi:BNR/Asp-box repeat protein
MGWARGQLRVLRPLEYLAIMASLLPLLAACGSAGSRAAPTRTAQTIAPPLLWQSATTLPPKLVSLRFAVSQPTIGYACAQNTGAKDFDPKPFVFRTGDGGQTWTPITTPFSTALNGPCDVWVNAADPNDVLVARSPQKSTDAIQYLSGLYRSRDGGKTWKALAPVVSSNRYSVMFAAAIGSRIFAFLGRFLDVQKGTNQLYMSADGGATWNQIGQRFNLYTVVSSGATLIAGSGEDPGAGPSAFSESHAGAGTTRFDLPLSGDPPPVVYYASTDGGNWTKMSLPYANVQPVVFTQGADGTLLGAGQALHAPTLPQVVLTRDGGANWTTLPDLTTAPGTDPTISPLYRDHLAILPDGTVFVSTTVSRAGGAPTPMVWRLTPGALVWNTLVGAPAALGKDGITLGQISQIHGAKGPTWRLWGQPVQDTTQPVFVDITA